MSFDPLAAVVDWLDAYRSGDLDTTLGFYADAATIQCDCDGGTAITGRTALRAYFVQRFENYPASELDDLQPAHDGAAITFMCQGHSIRSNFEFDADGQIIFQHCSPLNCVPAVSNNVTDIDQTGEPEAA